MNIPDSGSKTEQDLINDFFKAHPDPFSIPVQKPKAQPKTTMRSNINNSSMKRNSSNNDLFKDNNKFGGMGLNRSFRKDTLPRNNSSKELGRPVNRIKVTLY